MTDLGLPADVRHRTTCAAMGYFQDPAQANTLVGGYEYTQQRQLPAARNQGHLYGQFLDLGQDAATSSRWAAATSSAKRTLPPHERVGRSSCASPRPDSRSCARATTSSSRRSSARAARGRCSCRTTSRFGSRLTVNAGVLLNRDEFVAGPRGQRRLPGRRRAERRRRAVRVGRRPLHVPPVRVRRRDPAPPRRELQPAAGQRRQGVRRTGAATTTWTRSPAAAAWRRAASSSAGDVRLYHGQPHLRCAARGDDRQADRSRSSSRSTATSSSSATPRRFGANWGARRRSSCTANTNNFIEDVPSVLPDTGPYVAANLPCDALRGVPRAEGEARRTARSRSRLRRLPDGGWSANVSYTWSSSKATSIWTTRATRRVFNTSSIHPGRSRHERRGAEPVRPAAQDRPHVFKLFADYRFSTP